MNIRRTTSLNDSLVDTLEGLGVRAIFGLPGSQNIGLYESLRRSGIRSILTNSELAAGFMAIGWYRATGQPGVFVAMEGPGFAWSIAPLAEAAQDASAIIGITGKAPEDAQPYDQGNIGQDRIASALGAAVYDIVDPGSTRVLVSEAWNEVSNHGPKPVVLQVAADGQTAVAGSGERAVQRSRIESVDDRAFADALSALGRAARPVILAGAGSVEHAGALERLIDEVAIPCLMTPTARGVVPESHPLCLAGDLFFADVATINKVLEQSDLVLALGCRLSRNETAGFRLELPEQKLVRVASHSLPANGRYRCRLAVQADPGEFLRRALIDAKNLDRPADSGWNKVKIAECRATLRSNRQSIPSEPRWVDHGDCNTLFQKVRDGMPADGIIVTDTGLHQLLARSHLDIRSPRGLIFPSDFQSMGFGIPAAIGAALGARDRSIVAIVGDGSFLMVGPELIAAKREKLGLPVLVFCDDSLGIIRHQQIQKFGHEESTRLDRTDLAAFSSWLGIEYALANEHLAEQIQDALSRTVPTVIEVRLEDSRDLSRVRRKNVIKSSIRAVIGH